MRWLQSPDHERGIGVEIVSGGVGLEWRQGGMSSRAFLSANNVQRYAHLLLETLCPQCKGTGRQPGFTPPRGLDDTSSSTDHPVCDECKGRCLRKSEDFER